MFLKNQTSDLAVGSVMYNNTHHYSEKCKTSVATQWLQTFSCWPVLITCARHGALIIYSVQCFLNIDRYTFIPVDVKDTCTMGRKGVFGALLWLTSLRQGSLAFLPVSSAPPPARSRLCPTLSARRIQNPACLQQLGRERPTELWWTRWGGDEPLPALFERLSCKPKSLCGCLGVGESSVCASQFRCIV